MTTMLVKRPFEDTYYFIKPTGSVRGNNSNTELAAYVAYYLHLDDPNSAIPWSPTVIYWFKLTDILLTFQRDYTPHELHNLIKSNYPELFV